MKIAILYICTGKYKQFFSEFYRSSEQFLFADKEKTYFVFTDDMTLSSEHNVVLIHKECAGFPADSLFKFDMFMQIKEKLKEFDYIYFFNSNIKFVEAVGEEILPDESGLIAAEWPRKNMQSIPPSRLPYERRRQSLACIRRNDGFGNYAYYMGGLNGGTAAEYLKLIENLSQNIRTDYENGIIALFHDESHINHYFRHNKCKVLPMGICWPEEWPIGAAKPAMILRDKVRVDKYFDKSRNRSFIAKIKKKIVKAHRIVTWYI